MSFCDTANSLFYVVQILSISYFCQVSEPMDISHFKIHGISSFSFTRNSSSIKLALVGID